MAWTVDIITKYSEGNQRVHVLSCTADAATQNVDSGLEIIDHFTIGPQSLTAMAQVYANSGAAGTSLAGTLGCSGFTSGDVFYIRVYGR